MNPLFIAEIKKKSPFGYTTDVPFISLMEYAVKYGDWISVHTNALWGGDYDSISFVRRFTNKPILAKGIHGTDDDIQRALDHGADYVLVVDRIPTYRFWNKVIFEFSTLSGFKKVIDHVGKWPEHCPVKLVYNSRDLNTGLSKTVNELDEVLKLGHWTCQASNIVIPQQVNPNVQAFIVGECMVDFCKNL